MHRGAVTDAGVVFGEAEHAHPNCCTDEYGNRAYSVSGASIAVGSDDVVHLVDEWSSASSVTVEYISSKGGNYESAAIITEAASLPCPALNVDDDGAHITYVAELQDTVWYVSVGDDGIGEPQAVHEGDPTPSTWP